MNTGIFREYDIRGVAESDLSCDVVRRLGRALGTLFQQLNCRRIVVGHDIRLSSPRLRDDLVEGLLAVGMDVLDIGACPTPVLYFAVHQLDADGGVMVTGSHNPPEFNGFKIVVGTSNLYGEALQEVRRLAESGSFRDARGRLNRLEILNDYRDAVKADFAPLRRSVKVVVDSGNAAASLTAVELYRSLGCEVVPLFCEPDGNFPNHHPDPTVESYLVDLRQTVVETGADLGLGFDGDGDRLGVVDERGAIVPADRFMVIFARDLLQRFPGATVIGDVKCSRVFYEAIEALGGRPIMWKTGHSLIKAKMKEEKAILAGELAAHVCFGDRFLGFDDAVYAGARLIELLAGWEHGLSAELGEGPQLFSTPEIRRFCADEVKFQAVARVREEFSGKYEVVTLDGVRIEFQDGWGLLRASNTQPAVVLRFEAETESRLDEIRSLVEESLSRAVREVPGG